MPESLEKQAKNQTQVGGAEFNLEEIHEPEFCEIFCTRLHEEVEEFARVDSVNFKLESNCPACHSDDIQESFTCHNMQYNSCSICKTLFINPCPDEETIVQFLNTSSAMKMWREDMPSAMQESRNKLYEQRIGIVAEQAEKFSSKKLSIIEVGAGRGEFSEKLLDLDVFEKIHLVEPQELKITHPKIELYQARFSEAEFSETVDIIVSFEVLEHLINPYEFLSKSFELLKPGGILILTSPNADSFDVNILQERSEQVPFDHIRLYNPKALELMLQKVGFKEAEISTPGNFDVDLLDKARPLEDTNLDEFLSFIVEDPSRKKDFQNFLVGKKKSSHMRCIAYKDR